MTAQASVCHVCGTTYLIEDGCHRCNPRPGRPARKYTRKGIESPEAHEEPQELKTGASRVEAPQLSLGI